MSQKPKVPKQVQGRDYFCGSCAGRCEIYCPECVVGCPECKGQGLIPCPECRGGTVSIEPPMWDARAR